MEGGWSLRKSQLKFRMGGIRVLGYQLEIWDTWVLEPEPEATFGGTSVGGHGVKAAQGGAPAARGGHAQRWESKPSPVMVSSSSSLMRISSSHNSSGWEAETSREGVGPGLRGEAAPSGPGSGE